MKLLQAASHRWGTGKTHLLVTDGSRTVCGKLREECPGQILEEGMAETDCLVCQRSVKSQERWAANQQEWEERQRQQQLEEAERQQRWWADYNRYLESVEWSVRRTAVLQRDSWLCQGCRNRRASQVHHLTYERVGREMLFDLISVCDECHRQLHQR